MKKILKKVISSLGYELKKVSPIDNKNGHELYKYQKSDGSFDYQKYRETQINGNKRKIEKIWVQEENISYLSEYIKKNNLRIEFGLCHGTRRGKEQEWFRKYLNSNVIGTEISDTATEFPNTIQWDFHNIKDEWLNSVDFIYSNSFDHSYNPKKCLDNWMSCIHDGGMCIIEHTSGHERASELDPFGASISLMPYLILIWSEGKYCVTEILTAPVKKQAYVNYLIIQNK